jgi:hypothetical protein
MAKTILEDIKTTLGLLPDNLGFDLELLIFVNSAKVNLVQLGVTEMEIDIDEATQWPEFTSSLVGDLSRHYINLKARQTFDPVASETIAKTINVSVTELEGRLLHEIEETV